MVLRLATCRWRPSPEAETLRRVADAVTSTVRLGDEVLLLAEEDRWDAATASARERGLGLTDIEHRVSRANLHLVLQKGRNFQVEHPDVHVVVDKGRYLVVDVPPRDAERLAGKAEPCYEIRPLAPDSVVFESLGRQAPRGAPVGWIRELVDSLSETNYRDTLGHLVSYHDRHSTNSSYLEAAEWARAEFETFGYAAELVPISVNGGQSYNVVAGRPEASAEGSGVMLLVAHLDSINQRLGPDGLAPGADDNGSGSAGVLELARVLGNHRSPHDLRLILFGGEEQGLFGSRQYVEAMPPEERARLRAVINMDMIGTLNAPERGVLLEGAETSEPLVRELADAAATYTALEVQTAFEPWGSDHLPFIEAGLPAVLTIEGTDDANPHDHTENDTLDHIDYRLAMEILGMNLAVAAAQLGTA